jgi:polygalacturonase
MSMGFFVTRRVGGWRGLFAVGGLMCLPAAGFAQDSRTVTEPRIPPTCTTLTAMLTTVDGLIANEDEGKLDTVRIQRAIEACRAGQAVELRPGSAGGKHNAFVSGPLELRRGVTLLVAAGVTLYASRDPRVFDVKPGSCGIVTSDAGRGCKPLIHVSNVEGAAVMGAGADSVIDGQGGANLLDKKVSWWDLAQEAKFSKDKNAHQNCPRLIVADHANDFTLYRITLKNSPNFHVIYSGGNGFTAWGVIIDTPKTARNTDGIDPSSATNVTITHCYIHAGDDNVAIKAGASGPSSNITVAHNHFYTGHGMSIGSDTDGGVRGVRVSDLSIDGADNGIRIKSNSTRGGLVQDAVYEDVCIRDTKYPIVMDTLYPFLGSARNKLPVYAGIVLRQVRVIGKGKIALQGYDEAHRLGIRFDDVILDAPADMPIEAGHADVTLGPGPVNFRPSGRDVKVNGSPGEGMPNACSEKFVPLPKAAGVGLVDGPPADSRVIPIWPEGVPGAKSRAKPGGGPSGGPVDETEHSVDGRVSNVHVPTLTYFPAPKEIATGTAVIICPGGAYARLSMINEGTDLAERLNAIGVSAFVLKYRLLEYGHPGPLQDVLRAIRLVRSRAKELGVVPDRIGIIGSSAGGHLAATAATLYDAPEGRTGAPLDATSARPDFVALLYPVITMKPPFVHTGSRRNLLGENPSAELVDRLSVEMQVTKDTPPTFLVHTAEDTTVPLENSILFFQALRRAGVSAEMHLFEKGPHGFATRPGLGPTSDWPARWEAWMRSHGWLERSAESKKE